MRRLFLIHFFFLKIFSCNKKGGGEFKNFYRKTHRKICRHKTKQNKKKNPNLFAKNFNRIQIKKKKFN